MTSSGSSFTLPESDTNRRADRPALVLSPRTYNEKTSLALFCPITSKAKGYPFEVSLPAATSITGVILSDQIKSLDWRTRHARFACQAPSKVVGEVLDKLAVLLEP